MAKSKNHSNHNQTRLHHRNGIDKPKRLRYPDSLGVDQKFRRNLKRSRKGNLTTAKQVARHQARLKLKAEWEKKQAQ